MTEERVEPRTGRLGASGDIAGDLRRMIDEVWNRKNVGLLHDYLAPAAVVHTSGGDRIGPDAVVADIVTTLAAFPDLQTTVHDVVHQRIEASQDRHDSDKVSFLWGWSGHNSGHSVYGPPTGSLVTATGITTLSIRRGVIVEAWIVSDTRRIVDGLGIDDAMLLPRMRPNQRSSTPEADILGEIIRPTPTTFGSSVQQNSATDVEAHIWNLMHDMWNRRLLGKVTEGYAQDCCHHGIGGRERHGHDELTQDILALMAAFPDLTFSIDELFWVHDGDDRYRTAMRWSILGTHTGPGSWGTPTGRRVRITGTTHHRIEHAEIVEEWVVWDELSLLAQLAPLLEHHLKAEDDEPASVDDLNNEDRASYGM